MSIYEKSVKNPITTALIFVGVVVMGLFSLSKLPVDLFPRIEMNMLMVATTYDGASAADIETNVTRPLENVLNTVANLKKINSSSKENTSIITLQFEYGEDINVITNDVRDKIEMIRGYLPDGVKTPIIFKFSTDMIPVLLISASADQSLPALYKILDSNVANPLARIDGVGAVSISGAPQREIQVYVDPIKLEAYNLSIESITQNIRMENLNTPAGSLDIGSDTYSLRVRGEFSNPSEMNAIVVGSFMGKTILLSDVATVVDGFEERAQESYTDGRQGATIVIQKQSGANTVNITKEIRKVLPDIQQNLPSDIQLKIIMDSSDNIKNTINSLIETILFAFLFVILVVLFFLGRWRATIIIILTIPISLVAGFIYLGATGGSLNIISLSALSIAIGLVVDDAIVVLENITTHIERGSSPKNAAIHATNEVAVSVIASTLTLIAVFFPLTMVSGLTGVMFKQLGWMATITMVVSIAAALTLTPMMSSQMLRLNPKKSKVGKLIFTPIENFLNKLDSLYGRLINWASRHRGMVLVIGFVFFLLSMGPLITHVGFENMPPSDNSRIAAIIELPVGTRVEITKELAAKINNEWAATYPEIEMINYNFGQGSSSNIMNVMNNNGNNIATFTIRLCKPKNRKKTMFEITDELRAYLQEIPEIRKIDVIAGGGMNMMGGQSTVDTEIYGYNFEETDKVAAELAEKMKSIPGFTNIKISREDYQPEYQVDFDREKLALNGLNVATASTFLKNRMSGSTASLFREEGDEYTIRVVYGREFRKSLDDIENILIYNNQGKSVRIRDVGTVVERMSPPTIEHKSRQRIITVSGVASGSTIDKIVSSIRADIKSTDIPADVSVELSGSFEDMQENFTDLATLALIILILVFIVMASQFESLTYPFIIMFSIPFALSGVVLLLWITGTTFNTMTAIGIIMLLGIVVKNGIVLVDYINLCRERGMGVIRSVITGGKSRLRPVLMTSLTTILGMIPLAVTTGEGSEMWKPMAIAVIGGLTLSTILTLVIVPTFYAIFAGNGIKRKRRKMAKQFAVIKNNK